MAHLDVETTGLVAGYNEIVDLGVVRVNRALLEKVRAR
jgi:DNA polymerase III alpha subunit (gram-positive type)